MKTSIYFEWNKILDLLESKKPEAFKFFYSFHSSNGLNERDMYPSDRLLEIREISECHYQQLITDFTGVAIPTMTDEQIQDLMHEISQEGIKFFV
jgi:hypothetical protein